MTGEQGVGELELGVEIPGTDPRVAAAPAARWLRWGAAGLYSLVFVQQVATTGIPFDNWRLLAWLLGAMAIACIGRPWTDAVRLLRDWLPFALLLAVYGYSRGFADAVGFPVQVASIANVEKALFLGAEPSVWLQRQLLPQGDRTPVGLWEVGVTVVYTSHFVAPYVLAAYLWVRDRPAWLTYVTRFGILCALAVVTFIVLPAAPPWMAADQGYFGEVIRPVGRGWQRLSFHAADTWISAGRAWANPVAALPSLHTAFAALVALTLFARASSPVVRALVVAYPVAMGLVLVYGAEHYVVDVLAGVAYLGLAVVLQRRLATWWSRRAPAARHVSR
jgi:hypothetical protein